MKDRGDMVTTVVTILTCLSGCAQFFRKGQATNPIYIYIYMHDLHCVYIYRCMCNYKHNDHNELDNF